MIRSNVQPIPAGSGAPARPIFNFLEYRSNAINGIYPLNPFTRNPSLGYNNMRLTPEQLQRIKANFTY
jgi:hypothetical protein